MADFLVDPNICYPKKERRDKNVIIELLADMWHNFIYLFDSLSESLLLKYLETIKTATIKTILYVKGVKNNSVSENIYIYRNVG